MSTTSTSMAILKVNADRHGQDALDNFVPMVADRLFYVNRPSISVADLRHLVNDEYGVWIPEGALQTIVNKCAKRKLIRKASGTLQLYREKLAPYDLSDVRARVRREHTAVVRAGVEFTRDRYGRLDEPSAFEDALNDYIQRNAAPLLSTIVEGKPLLAQVSHNKPADDVVIASFIADLNEGNPEFFEYLSNVVKGTVLATALYFQAPETFTQRLTSLSVYLDTRILLRAIGACGPELQGIATEFIALGAAQGARIRCFRHTVREIEAVLDGCASAVRRPGAVPMGEAAAYMVSSGWGYSDVIQLIDDVEERLIKVGVTPADTPEYEDRFTLDEAALEDTLADVVGGQKVEARRKDVASISAIHRFRRGVATTRLAKARAIFVTTNNNLVAATRRFERIEATDRQTVPLCVAEHLIGAVLWLMRPMEAPELPVRSLVADSFATMRVDPEKWKGYVARIDDLKSGVTENEYVLLRDSLDVRALLVVDTNFQPGALTESRVNEALKRAREAMSADAIADARSAREGEAHAKAELSRVRAEKQAMSDAQSLIDDARNEGLMTAAREVSHRLSLFALAPVVFASGVGLVYQSPLFAGQLPGGLWGTIIVWCVFIATLVGAASLVSGAHFISVRERLTGFLTSIIYRRLQRTQQSAIDARKT